MSDLDPIKDADGGPLPQAFQRGSVAHAALAAEIATWRGVDDDVDEHLSLADAVMQALAPVLVAAEAVADERMASFLVELMTGIVPADTIGWDAAVKMLGGELRANRDRDARVRAQEKQRVADEVRDWLEDPAHAEVFEDVELVDLIAAGSAVPVATPGPTVDGVRTAALALLRWCDDPTAERAVLGSILARLHLPVATPPERELVQLVEARLQRWANEVHRKRHRPPVSVATPQPAADAETLRDLAPADSIMGDTMCEIADRLDAPVATPTEPGPAEPPKDLLAALQASVDRARGVAPAEQDGQR